MIAENTPAPSIPYRPEIDGLRAIAVAIVILFHVRLGCPGGYVGVDVFFVISGFLITSLIQRDLSQETFSFSRFWERRVRRIVPAMVFAILLVLIAGSVFSLPEDYARLGWMSASQVLGLSNIAHWRTTGYFSPDAETLPLLHTWSLAVEEQFYLLLPGLMWLIRNWLPRTRLLLFGIGMVCSWALGVWGTHAHHGGTYYLLPTRAWEMLLGSCLALTTWRPQSRIVQELLSVSGLAGIAVSTWVFRESTPFPGIAATLPTVSTVLFIAANQGTLTRSGRWLACPPLVFAGQLSYSLYLLHWPIIVFTTFWFREQIDVRWKCGMIAAAFVGALISWWLVETPVRQKKYLTTPRSLFTAAGASLSLLLVIGLWIHHQSGLPTRYREQTLKYATPIREERFFVNVPLQKVTAGDLLSLGAPSGDVRSLVWGDSHAMAILAGLDEAFRNQGIRGQAAVYSSTAPLLEFVSRERYSVTDSPGYSQAVLDYARRQKVKLVFLAAYWISYVDDPGFQESLAQTVRELTAHDMTVVIVRDVPAFPTPVPRWLARESMLGHDVRKVGIPLREHQQKNAAVDRLLMAQQSHSCFVIDPSPWLTDETGFCRGEMDGMSLYYDDDHLSTAGSRRLIPMLEDVLTRISQDP